MARARKQSTSQEAFKCPECGRTFSRAAALGAHRRQAHGVAGTSNRSRSTGRRSPQTAAVSSVTASSAAGSASSRRRRSRRSNASAAASTDGRGRGRSRTTADRDALLQTLFPNGIPPKEEVIRAVNSWLDEAERLGRMT